MKILHTADVHLGAKFLSLGSKGRDHRQQILRTFERVVDLACAERVDLFVVAGDLFDSQEPARPLVHDTVRSLQRLQQARIATAILPGTHDAYEPNSVYALPDFAGALPEITVLAGTQATLGLPHLNAVVHALTPSVDRPHPLTGLELAPGKLHIGAAHCSLHIPGVVENDGLMLTQPEIAASGLHYLALGHWHSFAQYVCGATIACYSGAPELINMDQYGAGRVLLVDVDNNGAASARPVQVGARRFDRLRIPLDGIASAAEVRNVIAAQADSQLVLQVDLEGLQSVDLGLDPAELEDALGDKFFSLRIADRSHPALSAVDAQEFPPETVLGRFVRRMQEEIAGAGPDDAGAYEEALRLGVALLQGREVLR